MASKFCISQMKLWHASLLLLLTVSSADDSDDYAALLQFKSLVSDPLAALNSWNSSNPHPCRWRGIACGNNSHHPGRVTGLKLTSLNLAGRISPFLSNLTFLAELDLSSNHFGGQIPREFSLLFELQYLNLSFNSLDGDIPVSLSNCSHLQKLVLRDNSLVGAIPAELGSLANLSVLNIGDNNLSGSIPASLGNISGLTRLFVDESGLEGPIPESLGKLTRLEIFQVSMNNLSGEIPPSLYNLSSIKYFVAGGNRLAGTLPADMFDTLPELKMVLLYGNGFHGRIPVSLQNASKLVELDLKDNGFSGPIPSDLSRLKDLYWMNLNNNSLEASHASGWDFLVSLTNCTRLGTLGLRMNRLGGTLPSAITNLSSHLDILAIGKNQIAGTIPDGIGNLANLSVLTLEGNQLSGAIPPAIGNLRKLYALYLSDNNFSGQIPSSIGNLTQLNQLDLRASGVAGRIPVSLGNCRNLDAADLSENKLSGAIPKELVSLSSLSTFLILSQNQLTGALPSEISKMNQLSALDVSDNQLSGLIPDSIGECQSLESLYLQDNFFTGSIPEALSKLKGLQNLDLSRNNLSGSIPVFLGRTSSLQSVNLSFNNLEGEVPKEGVFMNASGVSVTGNENLCGGVATLHLPACTSLSSGKKLSNSLKAIISVVSLLTCVILLSIIFVLLCWRKRKKSRVKYLSTSFLDSQFMKLSYAEIVRATGGFSTSNLIGTGNFGSVYKGILDSDGDFVAVKVLNLRERGASKSFVAECEALRNVRHRNLVRILTACSTVDSQGNDFKAIVLEFMPNGSLEEWLHPEAIEVSEQRRLSLVQRLNIAVDVASALDYLHNHTHWPIVHCDLKPSNVLLDEEMRAHVSDFGLASFLSDKDGDEPDEVLQQTSSAVIKGTIGYIAPEYGMGRTQVSTRADVFSYGILLLEMFTGRRPTDAIFDDGADLRKFVEMAFPDRVLDVSDPYFLPQVNEEEAKAGASPGGKKGIGVHECLVSVLSLGLACSREDPRERMEMASAAREMVAIRDHLHLDSNGHESFSL